MCKQAQIFDLILGDMNIEIHVTFDFFQSFIRLRKLVGLLRQQMRKDGAAFFGLARAKPFHIFLPDFPCHLSGTLLDLGHN